MAEIPNREFFNGWKFKDLLIIAGLIGTIYVGLYRVGQLEANQERAVGVMDKMADRQNTIQIRAEGREERLKSVEKRLEIVESKVNR